MQVVPLDRDAIEKRKRDAAYLRELADRVENGDVRDFAVALHDLLNGQYERYSSFDDRWRIYGALEYAKAGVDRADDR